MIPPHLATCHGKNYVNITSRHSAIGRYITQSEMEECETIICLKEPELSKKNRKGDTGNLSE